MPEDNEPTPPTDDVVVDMWTDEDRVCFVICNATVIEHNGALVPGLAFTPYQAIEIAEAILARARAAMEYQPE